MPGVLLAEALGTDARFAGTPVVLMTSAPHPPARTLLGRNGIRSLLQKPVREVALARAVAQAVAPLPEAPVARATASVQPTIAVVNQPAALRILVVEDNPVNQKVAVRLVEKLGHVTAVANDGREGLAAIEPRSSTSC